VSVRVDHTASWSADITQRFPIQTSVLLPLSRQVLPREPLSKHLVWHDAVWRNGLSCVFSANSCPLISSPDPKMGCLARCSPMKTGNGCGFALQSTSDIATCRLFNQSSTLSSLVVTSMRHHLSSQASLSRIEWRGSRALLLPAEACEESWYPARPALPTLALWCSLALVQSLVLIGDGIALVVGRFHPSDVSSRFWRTRRLLLVLSEVMMSATASLLVRTLARVFANARNAELWYLVPLPRCGYAGL
jgi:hypothetical protein